jgi:N-acetylglucosaminyldiphosphoundecaprenol N-acetyl-beta-D-mannosaminyltransferase
MIAEMQEWIAKRSVGHVVALAGIRGVMEAQLDPSFKRILNSADLVLPASSLLVWLGRRHGCDMRRRVYGPELVETFCCNTGPAYRHYFYGGGPGVAERVAEVLRQRYDVRTVGTYCPPFRTLSPQEESEVARRIRAAAPDILWVGLGTPKQERWMYEHRLRLDMPAMAGVARFSTSSPRR